MAGKKTGDVAVLENEKEVVNGSTVEWKKVAMENEQKAYEALEKLKEAEDTMAALMPDVRLAVRFFLGSKLDAGVRLETLYRKMREFLGQRGDEIDKSARGA